MPVPCVTLPGSCFSHCIRLLHPLTSHVSDNSNMNNILAEGIFREKQHVLVLNSDRLEVFSDWSHS